MKKLFDSNLTKRNLIVTSLFITSYETLRTAIIDRIKSFLCIDSTINEKGEFVFSVSEDYRSHILDRIIPGVDRRRNRDYHLFCSSCLWLKDMEAIDDEDIGKINKIRNHRNTIAHNPMSFLVDDDAEVNIILLQDSQYIITKIEKWWIINFEIPINPEFDGKDINEDDVQSGITILIDYLMQVAKAEVDG